jgi:hypothetical protein
MAGEETRIDSKLTEAVHERYQFPGYGTGHKEVVKKGSRMNQAAALLGAPGLP